MGFWVEGFTGLAVWGLGVLGFGGGALRLPCAAEKLFRGLRLGAKLSGCLGLGGLHRVFRA